jgi:hypothetical protein
MVILKPGTGSEGAVLRIALLSCWAVTSSSFLESITFGSQDVSILAFSDLVFGSETAISFF